MSYIVRLFVWVFIWVVACVLQGTLFAIENDDMLMCYAAIVVTIMNMVDSFIVGLYKAKEEIKMKDESFELEHGKAYKFEWDGLYLYGVYHKNYKVLITAHNRYDVGTCSNIKPLTCSE